MVARSHMIVLLLVAAVSLAGGTAAFALETTPTPIYLSPEGLEQLATLLDRGVETTVTSMPPVVLEGETTVSVDSTLPVDVVAFAGDPTAVIAISVIIGLSVGVAVGSRVLR